jgi:hypothetical protein
VKQHTILQDGRIKEKPMGDGFDRSIAPTTTAQQDLVTKGQRTINLIWETTQGTIAIGITGAVIYCATARIISEVLTNAFFLIIGFYFSRTNHAAIGGVGTKPENRYEGR